MRSSGTCKTVLATCPQDRIWTVTTMIFRYIRNTSAGKSERKPGIRARPPSPQRKSVLVKEGECGMVGEKHPECPQGSAGRRRVRRCVDTCPSKLRRSRCLSPYTWAKGIYQRTLGHLGLLESETQNFNTIDNPLYLLSFLMLFKS